MLYLRTLGIICIQFYASRIILVSLGIVDFGIYGVVGGVVLIFFTMVGAFGSATSRFFTIELGRNDFEQLKKVFSTAVAIHFAIALGVMLICESIGLWFLNTQMDIPPERMCAAQWLYQFSIISVMFIIVQVPYNAAIIAHEEMSVYAYVGLLDALGKLGIAYFTSFSPIDKLIWYGLLLMLLQIAVTCIYYFYSLHCYKETHFRLQYDKNLYKSMFAYSSYDMIGSMSVMAQGQGLNMVLNVFCGPAVNAARAIAYQVQGAATQFSNNFLTAIRPQIVKLYAQNDVEAMLNLVRQGSIIAYVLMLMIILPLSINIKFVLLFWLGDCPKYTDTFTVIILINALFNAFRAPRGTVFHATGHIKLSNLVTGSILCLALPLGYLLMKLGFNPNAVFWGMLGTTIISDVTNLLILRRYVQYSISDFLKKVHFKCCFVTLVTLAIVFSVTFSMNDGFGRLLVCTFVSIMSVSTLSWIVVLNRCQREKIVSIIKSKIHGYL